MKHPTRKPSTSDELVTIGKTSYERLWAEVVATSTLKTPSAADGWLCADDFAKRAGLHVTTARARLQALVGEGQFEKLRGKNQSNIRINYFRPIAQKPKNRKNQARK